MHTIKFSIFETSSSSPAIIKDVTLTPYHKPHYDSAVHTMIKDVGGEIPQWIEYHRLARLYILAILLGCRTPILCSTVCRH